MKPLTNSNQRSSAESAGVNHLTMNILSNKKLERLLAEKPFEALDFEAQNLVLESMDEEEYERLHTLVCQSKKALKNSPPPDPAIRQNLLAALRKQKTQPQAASMWPGGLLVKMLNYRLPVWQAAAAVAAVLGLFFWFGSSPLTGVKAEKVYVYVTDTIYKEVSLPGMDTAVNVSPGRVNVKPGVQTPVKTPALEIMPAMDTSLRKIGGSDVPDSLTGFYKNLEPPGRILGKEMKDLWRYWGVVN